MKPTRAQVQLAARLWTLALAANCSHSDHREGKAGTRTAESDRLEALGNRVQRAAARRAERLLDALGVGAGELKTDVECLEQAMRLKP